MFNEKKIIDYQQIDTRIKHLKYNFDPFCIKNMIDVYIDTSLCDCDDIGCKLVLKVLKESLSTFECKEGIVEIGI